MIQAKQNTIKLYASAPTVYYKYVNLTAVLQRTLAHEVVLLISDVPFASCSSQASW